MLKYTKYNNNNIFRVNRFCKKQNFLAKKTRQIDRGRAHAANDPSTLMEFFKLLKEEMPWSNPNTIWNVDEKGWSKQQAIQRPAIVTKGKPQVIDLLTSH